MKYIIDKIKGRLLANCRRLNINANINELPDGRFYVEFDITNNYVLPKNIELFDELPIKNNN